MKAVGCVGWNYKKQLLNKQTRNQRGKENALI